MRVKKCLIIEDEIYLAESIANKLQNSGFETKIVSSTREAMELDETFSAVLLSSNLEHEDTFLEVVKRFKYSTIMLMVSYINNDLIAKAVELGANDYILKPFKVDVLVQKLIYFQRLTDLEDRERKYLKFLDTILGENRLTEKDREMRLPLIVYSKVDSEIDTFVYFFAKERKKLIEIVTPKNFQQMLKENEPHTIYYFRKFEELSNEKRKNILESIKGKNFIIGTSSLDDIEIRGFSFKEIDVSLPPTHTEEILPVSEYIRQVVLFHQDKLPDTEISKRLGISRKSLWEKRRKFNIQRNKK